MFPSFARHATTFFGPLRRIVKKIGVVAIKSTLRCIFIYIYATNTDAASMNVKRVHAKSMRGMRTRGNREARRYASRDVDERRRRTSSSPSIPSDNVDDDTPNFFHTTTPPTTPPKKRRFYLHYFFVDPNVDRNFFLRFGGGVRKM